MRTIWKSLLLLASVSMFIFMGSAALAAGCYGDDQQTSISYRTDRVNCTTSGYCRAYGLNPATGRYEYYYGRHPNCPGIQERRVTIYHCLNSLGIGYTVDRYGPWGMCRVH